MERLGKPLVTILLKRYRTLRECVIASFDANGPMSDDELCRSLPHYKKARVREVAATLLDEVTGR